MVNIAPIIQQNLPLLENRRDVVALCRAAMANLRQQVLRGQLYIRYLSRSDMHASLMWLRSQEDEELPRSGVGVAYFDATSPNHVYAGAAILGGTHKIVAGKNTYVRDPWNRHLGQTVAALHYYKIPLTLAATWLITPSPFEKHNYITGGLVSRSRPADSKFTGPWQCLLTEDLPPSGRLVLVDCVRRALVTRMRHDKRFEFLMTYQHEGFFERDPICVANNELAAQLVDKWMKLQKISEEQRQALIAAGRKEKADAKAAEGTDAGCGAGTSTVPA